MHASSLSNSIREKRLDKGTAMHAVRLLQMNIEKSCPNIHKKVLIAYLKWSIH